MQVVFVTTPSNLCDGSSILLVVPQTRRYRYNHKRKKIYETFIPYLMNVIHHNIFLYKVKYKFNITRWLCHRLFAMELVATVFDHTWISHMTMPSFFIDVKLSKSSSLRTSPRWLSLDHHACCDILVSGEPWRLRHMIFVQRVDPWYICRRFGTRRP